MRCWASPSIRRARSQYSTIPGSATTGPLFGNATTEILLFDANGHFIREIGHKVYGLGYGHSIRYDRYDNLWIVDKGTDSVIKFDPTGKVVMNLGRRPEGFDSGHIEHAKQADARAVDGWFGSPTDVTWDQDDNIFVSDGYVNSRIAKLDKYGDWITSWGKYGKGGKNADENPYSIDNPHNLQADRDGNIYVADRGNRRIQVFDRDGNFKHFLFLNAPYDKTHHPVLGNLPPDPSTRPDQTEPWAICISPDHTAIPVGHRCRAGSALQDDAGRQDPRHAGFIGPQDGPVQLGARHRLPVRGHDLRRRHEQLAGHQAEAVPE